MATETASSSPGAPVPGQLPWELLATPSRDYFQWVQRRYGLTAAGACMASLASILCAVGTSHRVICPVDFAFLPAAYSAVLHGAIGLHIKGAVNLSLAPIREWISQRIGKGGKGLLGQARMHIAELHELLIQNDFLLQNAKSPPIPGTERFMMSEGDPEVRRSEIESQRKIILQQIEGHAFRLAPHLLADNTAMRQLLHPELLSHDGSVMHASGCHAVTTWCHATKAQKAELSRLLVNSRQGTFAAGEEGPVRQSLSNLIATDTADARRLLADRELTRCGVTGELFFVDALSAETTCDLSAEPPEETVEQWTSCMGTLTDIRITGQTVNHQLEPAASEHFESFHRGIVAQAGRSPVEEARRLERGPILCLKLAVLLHVASPGRDEAAIPKTTVQFAAALTDAVCTSDLDYFRASKRKTAAINSAPEKEDRELEGLVTKLRLRGPLRWRELLRGCHAQQSEPFAKLLQKAVDSGRVGKSGELYHAIEQRK